MQETETTTTEPSLADQIAALRAENEKLEYAASQHIRRHGEDIERIGASLLQEAENRGWCRDYDDFVNSLNDYLHISLPSREREWVVRQTYTVVRTIVVSAVDEESAANHDISAYNFADLDDGEWEVVDVNIQDTEIELADY